MGYEIVVTSSTHPLSLMGKEELKNMIRNQWSFKGVYEYEPRSISVEWVIGASLAMLSLLFLVTFLVS